MSRFLRLLGIAACICTTPIASAQLDFSISPTPVGSGARAAGMADAFVAIADDATAASWNPAGLTQLERPELSVVGSFNFVQDEFNASSDKETESTHTSSFTDLNFLSFVYPLPPFGSSGRNTVLSISYQRKYDFTGDFAIALNDTLELTPDDRFDFFTDFDFEQQGGLSAITPAIAIELTRSLSFGIAVNIWRSTFFDDNGWDQTVTIEGTTFFNDEFQEQSSRVERESYDDLEGENVTVGLLWQVNDRWRVGLRYDSGLHAKATYDKTNVGDGVTFEPIHEDRKLRLPDTWALGIAFRPNDRLTVAFDISRTDWNDFYIEQADGTRISLVDGVEMDDPDVSTDFDPTYSYRLGAEYVFIPKHPTETLDTLWSLRGGLFLDQEPASGRPSTDPIVPGDGNPDNFYGFAIGVGMQVFNRINIDAAYQLRYGNNVNSDRIRGIEGFAEDIVQHRFLLSTVLYF